MGGAIFGDEHKMARRTELLGICNDMLSAFASRNNDLRGYWALGQLKSWIEDNGEATLDIPLIGERNTKIIPQFSILSERFTSMLCTIMANHRMQPDWVLGAHFSIEPVASNRVQCSIVIVSDLGRSFDAQCSLLVRRHNPYHELKRAT